MNAYLKISFFIITLTFSISLIAKERMVYGKDNRVETSEYKAAFGDGFTKKLAKSVAAMIPSVSIVMVSDVQSVVFGEKLKNVIPLCAEERFREQMIAASCTGFLVDSDTLVTAAHCINVDSCASGVYKWVFDFTNEATKGLTLFASPNKNIYSCKEVVKRELDSESGLDYAIIKLDRDVEGRDALKVRKQGKISNGEALAIVGYPSGLPSKIADGAKVYLNSEDMFFQASLDSFAGNSGAPVFNVKTGLVEGILVRGLKDYIEDKNDRCFFAATMPMLFGGYESVVRITEIDL